MDTTPAAAMQVALFEGNVSGELVDAFGDLHRHYFGDAAPTTDAVARTLRDHILAPGSTTRVVVARDGARIAGLATFAILHPAPGAQGQLFMKDLYVRAAWRGRGVGELIMGFLARHAVASACVRFDWTTETGNPGAINFYERLGARRVTEKVYFRLAGEDLASFARQHDDPAASPGTGTDHPPRS